MITIHEITRSSTKQYENGAVFLVLFRVRSYDFVDRAGFFDLYILFFQQPAKRKLILGIFSSLPGQLPRSPRGVCRGEI